MIDGFPTLKILSEMQRKCRVKGRTQLHKQVSTVNENTNPKEEEAKFPKGGERRGWHYCPRQKPSMGGERGRWIP